MPIELLCRLLGGIASYVLQKNRCFVVSLCDGSLRIFVRSKPSMLLMVVWVRCGAMGMSGSVLVIPLEVKCGPD